MDEDKNIYIYIITYLTLNYDMQSSQLMQLSPRTSKD